MLNYLMTSQVHIAGAAHVYSCHFGVQPPIEMYGQQKVVEFVLGNVQNQSFSSLVFTRQGYFVSIFEN